MCLCVHTHIQDYDCMCIFSFLIKPSPPPLGERQGSPWTLLNPAFPKGHPREASAIACGSPPLPQLHGTHYAHVNENTVAFHVRKQRTLQPPSHHLTVAWMANSEGTQDGQDAHHQTNRRCSHP